MLNIGTNRECFFDTWLIDKSKTTAELRLHGPQRREVVLTHEKAWEGDGSDFHNFFFDDAWHGVDGVIASLAGREVTLTVRMRDADLYALRFGT